ncbi:MAG: Asp23/Gls24 family envelope stress response protein [Oscillospiraceae bacterium]|jgi:uncharacterized alkaline shock family protein YloU|nr:Asp23/Gls24 family envelope stress response protein [Oscillospiraceae bacterium]
MDNVNARQPTGSLKISKDVIATIAKTSAMEVDGVSALASPEAGVDRLFTKSFGRKPIRITLTDDFAEIDVGVKLAFGANIPDVCARVQANIKDNVQTMTGIVVSKINVTVAGVVFHDEAAVRQ